LSSAYLHLALQFLRKTIEAFRPRPADTTSAANIGCENRRSGENEPAIGRLSCQGSAGATSSTGMPPKPKAGNASPESAQPDERRFSAGFAVGGRSLPAN
jgi:hypothetical protein